MIGARVATAQGRRLRIAFVADVMENALGGGVVSGQRFVQGLRAEHDVVVVSTGAPGPDRVTLRGFQLPLHAMRAQGFRFALPDRTRLAAAFRDVDVVHLQHPFWLAFVALDEARKAGKPVVAAFHVQPENLLYNIGVRSPRLASLLYRGWVRGLYDRADAVVCPSRFAERKLREHGLTAPTVVVSNGTVAAFRRRPALREARVADGTFEILMVGRLAVEKRQDLLFEAMRRSRHRDRLRVVLAGAGPRETALRAAAARLPHPPRIGWIPDHELERCYNTADLMVHASEIELEGMAVLEGMSCGLPALVADSPESAATQFALGPEFLFRPGDADDLTRHIDWLVDHPDELVRARDRAAELSRGYSFERSLERLVALYRELVPPPGTVRDVAVQPGRPRRPSAIRLDQAS